MDETMRTNSIPPENWRAEFHRRRPPRKIEVAWLAVLGIVAALLLFASDQLLESKQKAVVAVVLGSCALTVILLFLQAWRMCCRVLLSMLRPLQLSCPRCGKHIEWNAEWTCGFCDHRNSNTSLFPFIWKCEKTTCGKPPKAFRCHHESCGESICLDSDKDDKHTAKVWLQPRAEDTEEVANRRQARQEAGIVGKTRLAQLLREQVEAETKYQLEKQHAKRRLVEQTEKPRGQRVEESIARSVDDSVAARLAGEKLKKEAATQWKEDSDLLEWVNEAIDTAVESNLP